jgi:hypothetical protein
MAYLTGRRAGIRSPPRVLIDRMRKEPAAYRNVFGEVNNKQKADIQRCAARARIP